MAHGSITVQRSTADAEPDHEELSRGDRDARAEEREREATTAGPEEQRGAEGGAEDDRGDEADEPDLDEEQV